jgi:hypothetical protein
MHGLPANAAQSMLRARSLFVRSARRLAEVAVGLGVGLGGRLLLLRLTRAASDAVEARRMSACDTYGSITVHLRLPSKIIGLNSNYLKTAAEPASTVGTPSNYRLYPIPPAASDAYIAHRRGLWTTSANPSRNVQNVRRRCTRRSESRNRARAPRLRVGSPAPPLRASCLCGVVRSAVSTCPG